MSLLLSLIAVFPAPAPGAPPEAALEQALADAETPPGLRAAFRATIASGAAVREIAFDPLAAGEDRFAITLSFGEDSELDAIVADWAAERQPDVRLFADDLRASVGAGRIVRRGEDWSVTFRHRISSNDGPVDAMVSQRMTGGLTLDPETGALAQLQYEIREPFRTPEGAVVDDYRQTYRFGYSHRWDVAYVAGYDLQASGGRLGFRDSRVLRVSITDVAFSFATDAGQELTSKSSARPLLAAYGADRR